MASTAKRSGPPPASPSEGSDAHPASAGNAAPATGLFPSRLLGFGVFAAWGSLSVSLEVSLDVASFSSPIARFFLLSGLCAALYIAVAAVAHRRGASPLGRTALILCGATSAMVPVLEFFASLAHSFALDAAALVCYSIATAGLFLMWNAQIASHGPKTAFIAYSGSFALATCIYFVVSALGGAAFAVSLVVLPLLSCLLLHLSSQLEKPDSAAAEDDVRWRIPWRPIALVVIFAWAFGTVTHFEGNALMPSELGRLASGALVLLAAAALFPRFDENIVAKTAAVLAAGSLLMCSVQGPDSAWGAGKLFVSVGYYGFMLFTLFSLSRICYSYRVRAEWLFGIVQASCVVVSAPSAQFGNMLRETALAGNPAVASALTAGLALVLLSACLFLLDDNPFAGTWGIKAVRQAAGDGSEGDGRQPVHDYLADRVYRCAMIARSHGLTHREEEVLSLLASGKSFSDIEGTLVIAHGTLRVHVQHLYEKLDVHSKQEAVDFVNEWRG